MLCQCSVNDGAETALLGFGRGGVFEPLKRLDFFHSVAVDQEAGTLVWPNGVDFCPDVLYAEATGNVPSMQESSSGGAESPLECGG